MSATPVIWHRTELGAISTPDALERIGMSTAAMRNFMRVDHPEDDPLIERLALAAMLQIEQYTGEVFGRRAFVANIKTRLPCLVYPAGHWRGGDVAVTGAELNGRANSPTPALDHLMRIQLPEAGDWKVTGQIGVEVNANAPLPATIQQALLMLVTYAYDGRGAETLSGWVHKSGATAYLAGHKRSHAAPAEAEQL